MKNIIIILLSLGSFLLNAQIKSEEQVVGNVSVTGQVYYSIIHGVSYFEIGVYTPLVTQNIYTKLIPGTTVSEADGITIQGDSIINLTEGDYKVEIVITLTGNNGDDFRVKMYKNGSTTGVNGSNHITTSGAGNYVSLSYFWYLSLAVSDRLSWYITNTTNNNDPTISDMKIFVYKLPEK